MSIYPNDPTLPGGEPEVGLHNGKFTNGDPSQGINPSRLWAPTQNLILDLIEKTIEKGNGSSNNTDVNQLMNAIYQMIHPVGSIQLFSFPEADLPFGWYLCDGVTIGLASAQGQALQSLSTSFKTAWSITEDTSDPDPAKHTITKPNLAGEILKAIDGTTRGAGSTEKGTFLHRHVQSSGGDSEPSNNGIDAVRRQDWTSGFKQFDVANIVSSAGTIGSTPSGVSLFLTGDPELAQDGGGTPPAPTVDNIGMTPAIFLNV